MKPFELALAQIVVRPGEPCANLDRAEDALAEAGRL